MTKGLGAGGTFGSAIWHIAMCGINAESRASWAVAPTYAQIEDPLLPTFTQVLYDFFGMEEPRDYVIKRSFPPQIEFKRYWPGKKIYFKSAHKPEQLVGATISHISGTEPGIWARLAYEKSGDRRRCPKAARLQSLFEGTPEGLNWYAEEADFPEGVDRKRNYRRLILETRDNPVLKPSYLQQLEQTYGYDRAKLISYTKGLFVGFEKSTAYWEFHESRNVVGDVKIEQGAPLILSFDWNKSPLAWVLLQRQLKLTRWGEVKHRYVALACSNGKARGILDACAEFIALVPPEKYADHEIHIDGDCNGYAGSCLASNCAFDQVLQALRPYYQNVALVAEHSNPLVKDRLQRVAALMAYEQYVIAAWCRNLIDSHKKTQLKPGTWEIEKPHDDTWTHFGDAVGYPLFRLTKHEALANPRQHQTWGTNTRV